MADEMIIMNNILNILKSNKRFINTKYLCSVFMVH